MGLTRTSAQVPQQIQWDLPLPGFALVIGQPQPLQATASSGLPVTFRVERGPALISGGTITATNVGTIRVIADQIGAPEYAPVSIARSWNEPDIEGTVVGTLTRTGKVRVDGRLLLVAGDGLEVFDIQDPEHPVFRGRLDLGETVRDVIPQGRHVLVTAGNRFGIVDVSHPEQPTLIGSVELSAPAEALAVEGPLACVAQGIAGFAVIDWSQPEAPALRASVSVPPGFSVSDVTMRRGLAYVAGPTYSVTAYDLGFPIPQPRSEGAQVWGPDSRLATDDRSLLVLSRFDLGVLELSREHESPGILRFPFGGGDWVDLSVRGDRAYLAGIAGGIWAVDISERSNPRLMERSLLNQMATSVAAMEGYAIGSLAGHTTTVIRLREGLRQQLQVHVESEIWLTNGPVTIDLSASSTSGQTASFRWLDGPAALSGNRLTITNAGSVFGEATVPGNEQFLGARVEWLVMVKKLTQSITFRPPPVFGLSRGSLPLEASASSGLPVTLELVSGPGTLEGNRLTVSAVGTVVIRAVQSGDLAYLPAESVVREIQILDMPEIVLQPSPTNVASGSSAVLQVVATGNGVLSFEWYRDSVRIEGANSATLVRATVGSPDMGLYHAVVRNDSGGSVTSAVVSLTIDLPGSEVTLRPRGSIPHRAQPTSSNPGRIEVQGRHAFVVNQALPALQILDIGDPDFPMLITTVPLLSTLRQDLALKDGYLLLAEREKGIGILDIRNPEKPVRLPSYRFSQNRADVVTLNVVGNRAFVGNGAYGFAILDVEDPTQPVIISSLDTSGLAAGIWLQDDWAYVADWASGLKVINIANLSAPRLVGRYPAQDATVYYYDLVGRGGYAYLTREAAGLLTFDIRQPLAPSGIQTNRGSIFGLELAGQTLFAADNNTQQSVQQTRGIRLFDVSRPDVPLDIGRFADWGRVDGIRLDGNRLLVTGDRFGIVDLEFPERPPALTIAPRSQVVRQGEAGFLESMAIGGEPLSYQWWHRGAPLPVATNRTLTLGPITLANAGDYVVKVHNPWGTTESAPARIGFEQRLSWELLETNTVLRLQQPYPLTAISDSGLPISYQIVSGPATLADGQLLVTNVGSVRLKATQPGNDAFLPVSREWTFNIGEVQFVERGVWPEFITGNPTAVDVERTTAILAIRESGLLALDVSDPGKPRLLGQYAGQGEWTDVQVVEGIAYAMNSTLGLVIVDFRNPAHPLLRSTLGGGPPEGRVAVANQLAYLHGPWSELRLVDVSDPSAPTLLSTNPNFYSLDDLVVRGNRVLATGLMALGQILDVSDPRNPTRVSITEVSIPGAAIAAQDDWVAVARRGAGLDIFRLAANGTLEHLAHLDFTNGASHVEWKGQYLCVASGPDGLVIVDAADPRQPKVITNTDTELLTGAGSFRIVGDHAYVTDGSRGLVIHDLQSPASPSELGWFPTAFGGVGIRVQGNHAFLLTGRAGLAVLDVSNPERPSRISGIPSRNRSLINYGNSLSIDGNRVYFTDGAAGVQIVEVENPAAPSLLGIIEGVPLAVVAHDAALHIGDTASTIRTWDVTDASNPVVIGTAPLQVRDFHVSGNWRISAGIRNLWIEDLSLPANPITLSTVTFPSLNFTSLDVAGDYVFLAFASSFGGLIRANIANPQSPFEESRLNNLGQFASLDVEGEYLFAAKEQGGLAAYHAFLPTGLKTAGSKAGPWTAEDLQVVGELIYVADSRGGLRIFQARPGIPQELLGALPVSVISGTAIDLPERSAAGLLIRYTVVEGNAVIEGRILRITGPGILTIRAEVDGDAQFLPAVVQREVYAVDPPVVTMDRVEAGIRFRWVPNSGNDTLKVTDSLNEPANWQPAEILSTEYSTEEMILSVTVPAPQGTRFYRVLRW